MLKIQLVDHQTGSFALLVMASDAVLCEHGGWSLFANGRAARLRQGCGRQEAQRYRR